MVSTAGAMSESARMPFSTCSALAWGMSAARLAMSDAVRLARWDASAAACMSLPVATSSSGRSPPVRAVSRRASPKPAGIMSTASALPVASASCKARGSSATVMSSSVWESISSSGCETADPSRSTSAMRARGTSVASCVPLPPTSPMSRTPMLDKKQM